VFEVRNDLSGTPLWRQDFRAKTKRTSALVESAPKATIVAALPRRAILIGRLAHSYVLGGQTRKSATGARRCADGGVMVITDSIGEDFFGK
jgi:hypothetical protein